MTLLRAHWRKLALVLALLGAFAGGRFSVRGPRVVEKVVEVKQAKAAEVVAARKEEAAVSSKERIRIVYRERIVRPDGTQEASSTSVTASSTQAASAYSDEAMRSRQASQVSSSTRERTEEPQLSQWRVGIIGGLDVPGRAWIVGGEASRRIAGPLWIGAWANNRGHVGASVGLEF